MYSKPKIAVLDDDEVFCDLWMDSLSQDAEVFPYTCFENFFDLNKDCINKYDYILVDMIFSNNRGNFNMLTIDYSTTLRDLGFNGNLILNSNLNTSTEDLESKHCFDLFLPKNVEYSLSEIKNKLEKEPLNWKKREEKFRFN